VPDETTLMAALVVAPPAPEFPAALHGQPIVVLGAAYHGGLAEGERELSFLREFAPPAVDLLGPVPYVALQQMVDAFTPRGLHYYVKSEWLADIPDEAVDALVAHHLERTSAMHQILLHQMGGAVSRVAPGETAFTYRNAAFEVTIAGCWPPGEAREPHVEWVRSAWRACLAGSLGGAYVNHLDADEGEERVRAAYGAAYDRLAALKAVWDPHNVFRGNHNIHPVRGGTP
jgi:hypothetical protein